MLVRLIVLFVSQIVGNLIRTFGGGWEDEIPSILKKDMKSLNTSKGDASQPLNLQQRVIQSGLDSLVGADAADIVVLFKGKCYECATTAV